MKLVWRFLKSVPKYLLVLVVMVGSTALFAFWWMFRTPEKRQQAEVRREEKQQQIRATAAEVGKRLERLLLIDNQLYDSETGELLFSNWLKEGMPLKLYIEPDRTSLLAQYGKGFVRYGFDGVQQASLILPHGFPVDDAYRWALYCKDGDIWRADMDWKELKFVNERKVTSTGQFHDGSFKDSFLFGTDDTLVLTVMNRQVRVNLATGDVKPVRYPLDNLVKRRSPDSRHVVGVERGQFYCHNVDSEETKAVPIGRAIVTDFLWAGNEKCYLLVSGTSVACYDRTLNTITEICALPGHCVRIGELSPDDRYIFCKARNGLALVDLEQKKVETSFEGEGIFWLSTDSFIFSRNMPDSAKRGVWIYQVGSGPRRVHEEPYLVAQGGDSVLRLQSGPVVFLISSSVLRMNPGSFEIKPVKALPRQKPDRLLEFSNWRW